MATGKLIEVMIRKYRCSMEIGSYPFVCFTDDPFVRNNIVHPVNLAYSP